MTTILVVAFTAAASGRASATSGGRIASTCPNLAIGNATTGEAFFAFVLHGKLTCSRGHSLMRSYFGTVSARGCAGRGTICGYNMPGRWSCASAGAAGERFDAGCFRGSTRVQVYEVSPPASLRGVLHLRQFESPDGSTACLASTFGPREVLCSVATGPETASHYGLVLPTGHVTVCNESQGSACLGLTLRRKVILGYGQETELNDIRCTSAPNGITCTKVSGAAQGKGFRINANEAVEVG